MQIKKVREERWYAKDGSKYLVYDHPIPNKSVSVSIVDDLSYYKIAFKLNKVWG
jgi:hypothetical protein